jgi:hypothetical protein
LLLHVFNREIQIMLRFVFAVGTAILSSAAFAESGELWDYNVRSSMMPAGMQGSQMTICKKAGWTRPPEQKGPQRCETAEFNRSGDKITWNVKCPDGTGHGEMTLQGTDDFKGTMTYEGKQGRFTSNMSGHKKGSCELQAGEDMRVEAMNTPGMPGGQLNQEQIKMIQEQMKKARQAQGQ